MGFSQVIGLSLIAFVVLSLATVYGATALRDQQIYSQAEQERQSLYEAQLSTQIKVISWSLSGNLLSLEISNNGSTTLFQYSHFSVVVKYYANVSDVASLSLSQYSYMQGKVSPLTWNASSILEPDDVATITIGLPYPPYQGLPAVVVLDSNYGPGVVWRGTL
jgi:flagellar protein FlaF